MSQCHGNAKESPCCWLGEKGLCKFLVHVGDGRKGSCGLFIGHGSWDAVHSDPLYLATVRPVWDNTSPPIPDCGDWVGPGCCYGEGSPDDIAEARLKAAERAFRTKDPEVIRVKLRVRNHGVEVHHSAPIEIQRARGVR